MCMKMSIEVLQAVSGVTVLGNWRSVTQFDLLDPIAEMPFRKYHKPAPCKRE